MAEREKPKTTESQSSQEASGAIQIDHPRRRLVIQSLVLLVVFAIGAGSGYLFGIRREHIGEGTTTSMSTTTPASQSETMTLMKQINPPDGYKIEAAFRDIGPQLIAAGAIDLAKFTTLYKQQKQPLDDGQLTILTKGTDNEVIFTPRTAYFLLNFFWALGLTNQNDILTSSPMTSGGKDRIGGFASTGGWTIGAKGATELFASTKILTLTEEQQARLREVAAGVFRPCCNNPTDFPDCNHGMAMLGLLELMASQDASSAEMYEAAKYVNAFWYPQQMLEIATLFKDAKGMEFAQADAKSVVSRDYSSGTGYQTVHQWLSQNGLLEQAPSSGGGCGVK